MKLVSESKEEKKAIAQHNYMLCKLKGEKFLRTRALYEEVFPEDSRQFVDYYYEVKSQNSVALVLQKEEGEIVSMLHLNPYKMAVRDGDGFYCVPAYYIVAVATKKPYRHQGCMARLLREAEHFCNENKVPLLFLMPADPTIYRPFGYEYIFRRPEFYFSREIKEEEGIFTSEISEKKPIKLKIESRLSDILCEELAQFAIKILKSRFDFFIMRDKEYYANLSKELEAQKGEVGIYYLDKEIVGYYTKTGEEPNMFCGEDCICEALFAEDFEMLCKQDKGLPIAEKEKCHEIIMGKLINVSKGTGMETTLTVSKRGWIIEIV